MSINSAQDELDRVFATTWWLLGKLTTFYNIATNGLFPGVRMHIEKTLQTFIQMHKSGELAELLLEPNKVDEYFKLVLNKVPKLSSNALNTAKSAVDSACIVFAHGILDASVYGYLTVTSLACPESWECYIERKKIELSSFKSKQYEQMRNDKIQDFLERTVEKSSLMYKLDLLHNITQPTTAQINPDYKYDRKCLEKLDDIRHRIVHGNEWDAGWLDFDREFFYWELLNWYFLRIVAKKTSLRLSVKFFQYMIDLAQNKHSE